MISVFRQRPLHQIRWMYQVRSGGHWNKDWKPGNLPMIPEQYEAAAKKYNLLPQEYEPYPSSNGILEPGDYPKLPEVSVENKDIYYQWDLPDERRNFGEPLHVNAVYFGEQRCDTHVLEKFKYTPLQMFLGMLAGVVICYIITYDQTFLFFPPVAARHYPKPGVVHYTYETPK